MARLAVDAVPGAFDVAVDLRPDSPTFRRWFGIELDPGEGRMLRAFGEIREILTAEDTSGQLFVGHAEAEPGFGPPPPRQSLAVAMSGNGVWLEKLANWDFATDNLKQAK